MLSLLLVFVMGIAVALLARPIAELIKSVIKNADIRKVVSITAYYGAGIWTSLMTALANAIVSMSFTPILSILKNPLRYYDYELVAGDLIVGMVGFITWFLTVFAFYALLVRKVAESIGATPKARYVVMIATPFTLLFLYAFGFRNTLYIAAWLMLSYVSYVLIFLGGIILVLSLTRGD